jgi:enoyl-CoA hydratase/carnithine racemase
MISVTPQGPALHLGLRGLDANGMFTEPLLRQLSNAVAQAPQREATRCIVLTNHGPVFCRGGNVGSGTAARQSFAQAFCHLLHTMAQSPLPIVAAVNGLCAAGGMTLLAATDYAICVESATFGYPELAIGAFPMLATVTAPAHLPKKAFFEMAYSSRMVDATTARSMYLVNEVVADETALETSVSAFCSMVATRNRSSIAQGRMLYHQTLGLPAEAWLDNATSAMIGLPELHEYR